MNVFEDLVEELKEDQLLEETVIDFNHPVLEENSSGNLVDANLAVAALAADGHDLRSAKKRPRQVTDKKKFNSDEIAALQVVELVFTGVERDLFNIEPEMYDELSVKQALHRFVHCAAQPESDEALELEALLYSEIENWKNKLLARDAKMSPADLRLYCQTSQPPLSSQALFALARFYFGTGITVASAPKIESILTRLFSKRDEGERRETLLNKEETIGHLRKRFLDWSGHTASNDIEEPEAMLSIMSLEDFSIEAGNAESFDVLLKGDFFNRIVLFKESIREQFKSPEVMAACIRGNITIGNAVVSLLEKFGQKMNPARLKKKLGILRDDLIGRAVARTIDLEQLFSGPDPKEVSAPGPVKQRETKQTPRPSESVKKKPAASLLDSSLFAVNKWFLFACILLISASVGLYVWTEYYDTDKDATPTVPAVELAGFEYRENVKTAKISGETMYAVMAPTWDSFDDSKKQEVVKGLYAFAVKKGVKKLNVMDRHGASVASATPDRVQIIGQ